MSDRAPTSVGTPVDFDPFAEAGAALALTEQQREMWTATLMSDEANCSYNQSFVLCLQGAVSHASLQRALEIVVARHEAMRIRIDAATERQQIMPNVAVRLPLLDLTSSTPAEREAAIAAVSERETHTPFDIEAAPLWRAQLILESADRYRFVFTAHHLILDGWSSAVMFSDLASAYATDRFGMQATLPIAASYTEFVERQSGATAIAEREAAEEFWVAQYARGVPQFELPLDRERPRLKTYRAERQTLTIDATLYDAVRKVGAKHGATPFATLLAGFEVLIARLATAEEFVIGIPMASQTIEENGHFIAHGVNTVPLACRVDPRLSFADHLRASRRAFLDAQAHQQLTFGNLVRRLKLPRDPSRTPLVSVIFNIDKVGSPFDFGAVRIERIETPKAFYNFELGINAVDNGKEWLLECDYNADLFDAATIRRWLSHYRELLAGIVANPSASCGELPLLTSAERQALLSEGVALPRYEVSGSLHERFAEQAKRRANEVALIAFDGEERRIELTYAELEARAERVAQVLRASGVRSGELVGLRTERNLELVVGLLGILKAGGAYLPLDPVYPLDRVRFMLGDAGVKRVLTQRSLAKELEPFDVTAWCLDEPAQWTAAAQAPRLSSAPDDLAYVIYTSGSTGQPKGVGISHRNVLRLFAATEPWFGFDERDVWTLFHSYAFDFSVWELWGALLYGGRLLIVPQDLSRNPQAFRELLVRERVTVLNQTPTAFRQLIDADRASPPAHFALKHIVFGGEALELKSLTPWIERYGDAAPRLINMYGITETTVHVTYRPITRADVSAGRGSVIGEPIPDLRLYLLDQTGQPVPTGVPGEMFVAGAGLAPKGYLNRPELSAQRFVPNPFLPDPAARMYRSGDLARRLPSGELEYLGRIDSQVKIRGFRIELGEIEALIAQAPGVRQAAVIDREDTPGQKRLAAYLVCEDRNPALIERLRERLRRALPDYMVPAHFLFLDHLPLTPNGKLDRRALPVPEMSAERREKSVPPRTASETLVVAAFCEVLDTNDVGVLDNFFDLGGDSLMAARMMARLRATSKVDLPLRNLFERPTPERLAAAIDALTLTADTSRNTGGEREEIEI